MKITDEMVRIAKNAWSNSIIDTSYDIEERREIGIRAALEAALASAPVPPVDGEIAALRNEVDRLRAELKRISHQTMDEVLEWADSLPDQEKD